MDLMFAWGHIMKEKNNVFKTRTLVDFLDNARNRVRANRDAVGSSQCVNHSLSPPTRMLTPQLENKHELISRLQHVQQNHFINSKKTYFPSAHIEVFKESNTVKMLTIVFNADCKIFQTF